MPAEFQLPEFGPQAGWRMTTADMQNMRVLMADRQIRTVSGVLRDLVSKEAAATRQRWKANQQRIDQLQESDD